MGVCACFCGLGLLFALVLLLWVAWFCFMREGWLVNCGCFVVLGCVESIVTCLLIGIFVDCGLVVVGLVLVCVVIVVALRFFYVRFVGVLCLLFYLL